MKKIAVFSDVHFGTDYLKKMLSDVDDVDYLFFLGDGLNNVLSNVSDAQRNKLHYVEGNCDTMYQHDEVVDVEGKRFLLTHGNKYGVKHGYINIRYKAEEMDVDAVCFGHTHIAYHDRVGGIDYINPGSLGYGGEYCLVIVENGEIFVIGNRVN